MIKPNFFPKPIKTNYEYQIGESIETKVKRITENNEPITDGATNYRDWEKRRGITSVRRTNRQMGYSPIGYGFS